MSNPITFQGSAEQRALAAVSYTHLDVYKRQVVGVFASFAGKNTHHREKYRSAEG